MKKLLLLLLILSVSTFAQKQKDPTKMDEDEFMKAARESLLQSSWVKMQGKLSFRSTEGGRALKHKIDVAAHLIPNKVTFQTLLSDKEKIKVLHQFGKIHKTETKEDTSGENGTFKKMGIRPSDLSLSFMYWDIFHKARRKRHV